MQIKNQNQRKSQTLHRYNNDNLYQSKLAFDNKIQENNKIL